MELPEKLTIGEKYQPAMKIEGQAEADEYFEACVVHQMRHGYSRQEAIDIEHRNLGYFAGYHDDETRARVERLFNCHHPIFGPISKGSPTAEEALEMGRQLAIRVMKERATP